MRIKRGSGGKRKSRHTGGTTYARTQRRRGKRAGEEKRANHTRSRSGRQLRQLVVSALILVSVISVKLLSPQTLEPIRTELLRFIGTDADLVAVFSAVGRSIGSEEDWGQTINDACVAVFGVELPGAAEHAENVPEDVCMLQQMLGFSYAAPLQGEITDRFGARQGSEEGEDFHYGVDIAAETGTVIHAFAAGTVTAVGESSTLGKYVTVAHGNGYATLYAHCSRVTASSGQQVQLSDPIAEVGETGRTTGPHLHFELYRDTLYLNPIYYVGS